MIVESIRYYELADDLPAYYGDASPVAHTVDVGVEFVAMDGTAPSLTWVNSTDTDGGLLGHLVVVEQPMNVTTPFDDQPPVTILLGTADSSGGVEYAIDELVVFHDNAARTYLAELAKRHTRVSPDVMLAALNHPGPTG